MPKTFKFSAITAHQSDRYQVFTFAASASEIFQIARIERAGRNEDGNLLGFQRPQVARHINEIRDYLSQDEAVLPNSVVLAFVNGVSVSAIDNRLVEIEIDVGDVPPGQIVDGQQRLTALYGLPHKEFQLFVTALVCGTEEELRRQFILINNTRPLPKELIYELLPTVNGLPYRLSSRAFAANLATKLNYLPGKNETAALFGEIKQHTNPEGSISSNAIQRVIMNSRSNGALRYFSRSSDPMGKSLRLISDFYGAVLDLFPEAWVGMTPRTSRLKHSAGIISLGYAMEIAYAIHGARTRKDFCEKLKCLATDDLCAWISGTWVFGADDHRRWDQLQNTPPDIRILSNYLVRLVRDQGLRNGSDLDVARRQFQEQRVQL